MTFHAKLSGIADTRQMKDAYEKQYQGSLKEVVDKQKDARNESRAAIPTTVADIAERKRERERERK